MKKLIVVSALSIAGLMSSNVWAESQFVNPAVTGSIASARLDFTVVIPQVLFLRVGSSSGNTATDGTINGITYTVPAANVGDSVAITGAGGDLTAGAVTVRVYGNGGGINLNSNTTGPLTTGTAGEVIPWSEITVAAAPLAAGTAGFANAAISHPAFNTGAAGGAGTVTSLAATNKVVRVEGKWTYSYANTTAVAAGTYGGTAVKNGRVTYTATQL
jgi:hypothetical protein